MIGDIEKRIKSELEKEVPILVDECKQYFGESLNKEIDAQLKHIIWATSTTMIPIILNIISTMDLTEKND